MQVARLAAALTAVLGLAVPGACALHVPRAPQARVRRGPASGSPPARLLASPSVCSAADATVWWNREGCRPAQQRMLDAAARMSLEFAGYAVLDSEQVNLRLGRRRERARRIASGTTPSESATTVEVTSATWVDASDAERRELVAELEVDGFLASSIDIGPPRGLAAQRTVEVELRVLRARGGGLVWSSRCGVETGDYHSMSQAVELATRCAIESATLAR